MSLLTTNRTKALEIIKYLTDNQYLYEMYKTSNGYEFKIFY